MHLELSRHHLLQTVVDTEKGAVDMGSHSILVVTLTDISIPFYRRGN